MRLDHNVYLAQDTQNTYREYRINTSSCDESSCQDSAEESDDDLEDESSLIEAAKDLETIEGPDANFLLQARFCKAIDAR